MKQNSFYNLDPSKILSAVESLDLNPTGLYFQLNSYENRVFDLEVEDSNILSNQNLDFGDVKFKPGHRSLIVKFYRPQRWSKKSIQDEHDFLFELYQNGVKAVCPYKVNSKSVFEFDGMYFCLFPKAYGRSPQELLPDQFEAIGRTLARLHNVGEQRESLNRPFFEVSNYGDESLNYIEPYIYPELKNKYFETANNLLDVIEEKLSDLKYFRIHGDCHKGNILQTDPKDGFKEYFFVDFDDFCNGPAVQDFWMLLSDSRIINPSQNLELENLIKGYRELREFNESNLKCIPHLRALRIIYYAGWIAKRWSDPSFKQLFPHFLDYNYWAEELESLTAISNL